MSTYTNLMLLLRIMASVLSIVFTLNTLGHASTTTYEVYIKRVFFLLLVVLVLVIFLPNEQLMSYLFK